MYKVRKIVRLVRRRESDSEDRGGCDQSNVGLTLKNHSYPIGGIMVFLNDPACLLPDITKTTARRPLRCPSWEPPD